jgi:uncharacterized protein YjbI with pentapeptide repeats
MSIADILEKHALWLKNDPNGKRAYLSSSRLWGVYWSGINLSGADLSWAYLSGAYLCGANLSDTDLSGAFLLNTILTGANLAGSNLQNASLRGADLIEANLTGANLTDTWLEGTKMDRANLKNTCLDPANIPNKKGIELFESVDSGVIGYRTRYSHSYDGAAYEDGKTYKAPIFSTAYTECHPGLYIFPTLSLLKTYMKEQHMTEGTIKVLVDPNNIHGAGNKWRCRAFTVIGKVDLTS